MRRPANRRPARNRRRTHARQRVQAMVESLRALTERPHDVERQIEGRLALAIEPAPAQRSTAPESGVYDEAGL